jgi:hypothetical protein
MKILPASTTRKQLKTGDLRAGNRGRGVPLSKEGAGKNPIGHPGFSSSLYSPETSKKKTSKPQRGYKLPPGLTYLERRLCR